MKILLAILLLCTTATAQHDHGCDVDQLDEVSYPLDGGAFDFIDSGKWIDIMVLYTPATRQAIGTGTHIETMELICDAVAKGNIAFTQSGVDTQLRIAHMEEIPYTEGGSFYDLRMMYLYGQDPMYDTVQALRNQYKADVVTLMADYGTETCGKARLMRTLSSEFESQAFNVVNYACADGNLSLIHEIAHNMGSHHAQPESGVGQGLYNYSYGWRWGVERSIMAYQPGIRVARFSNPDIKINGEWTGSEFANNALSLRNAIDTVANFRTSELTFVNSANDSGWEDGGKYTPYDTLSEGLQDTRDGAKVKIKGDYAGVVTIDQQVTIDATDGAVRIGG
jgi:hypothetical protein